MSLLIRDSVPEDVAAIAAIFGHAVLHGNASFEIGSASGALKWDGAVTRCLRPGFPFLVAEDAAGRVVGYCSAGTYRPRPGIASRSRTRSMSRRIVRARGSAGQCCRG